MLVCVLSALKCNETKMFEWTVRCIKGGDQENMPQNEVAALYYIIVNM